MTIFMVFFEAWLGCLAFAAPIIFWKLSGRKELLLCYAIALPVGSLAFMAALNIAGLVH